MMEGRHVLCARIDTYLYVFFVDIRVNTCYYFGIRRCYCEDQ